MLRSALPKTTGLAVRFAQLGVSPDAVRRLFHAFYANEPRYLAEGERDAEPAASGT